MPTETIAPVRASTPPAAAEPARRRRRGAWVATRRGRQYLAVALLAALFVFPFLVMVSTAFKGPEDIFSAPPRLLPRGVTWDNFVQALDAMPFWRYLGNSLLVSGLTVVGAVLSSPMVAYALAKIRWRGSKPLLVVVLATMMLPPQVTMIPVFMLWDGVGATNSYLPLVVPAFLGVPFLIFMIRQFLVNVPNEIIDAARVDGANEMRVYWSIVLPIARPAIVTAAIFQFVWSWTDFLGPLIYLNDPERYTLSIGLYAFFTEHDVAWGPLMAACAMFTLPALLLYLAGQRYLIGGISSGAVK